MHFPIEQLVQIMVKFHFGNLGCEKGWCQNHSRYGTYQHAHYHFRFEFHLLMSSHTVQYSKSLESYSWEFNFTGSCGQRYTFC